LKKTGYEGREAVLDGSNNMIVYRKDGTYHTGTETYGFNAELKTLNYAVKTGQLQNGDTICLQEKDGSQPRMFVIYLDGKFYNITPSEYSNTEKAKRVLIKGYNGIKRGV
jgi:hypothetical protein